MVVVNGTLEENILYIPFQNDVECTRSLIKILMASPENQLLAGGHQGPPNGCNLNQIRVKSMHLIHKKASQIGLYVLWVTESGNEFSC